MQNLSRLKQKVAIVRQFKIFLEIRNKRSRGTLYIQKYTEKGLFSIKLTVYQRNFESTVNIDLLQLT